MNVNTGQETSILTFFASTKKLTRSETLEIPTVAACISKLAGAVASLPVKLYRKEGGRITEITDDGRLKLLNGDTGDTLSTHDMWTAAIEDYFLGGGAWIYINSAGLKVRSLHYIDSRSVSILSNSDPVFKAFRVQINAREYYDFQFIKLLRKTHDGWTNIPLQEDNSAVLSAAYNAVRLENMMNSNGGCKPGFLKAQTRISKEVAEDIRRNYDLLYNNSSDRSERKLMVLNDGITFEPISSTAAELQLNENKQVNSMEICKLFGFPHTIIDGGASEDDNRKFISAVTALVDQIETELDRCLLLESEKEQGYYWAFDTKELTRGSIRERFDAYEIAARNNIMQIDEIRREEDLEPLGFNFVKLGLSDVLLNPQTMEVFTPNTGQTKNLLTGEERARGDNYTKDEHGRFTGSTSSGGGSSGGKAAGKVDKSEKTSIIKSIDVDDYKIVTYGKGISKEVNDTIIDIMKQCEKDGGFVISEISGEISATGSDGTPVLQIEPMSNGLLKLNINTEYLSGKTLDEIDNAFANTNSTVVNSLKEAVIHESGHAISIKGKTPEQVENLYKELKNKGIAGVSDIALKDGAECLAELEVLRSRKVSVSKELSDFYEKYMGRKYL